MVVRFNRPQAEIIGRISPGRDVIAHLHGPYRLLIISDVARIRYSSWDSYPLDFLEDRSDQACVETQFIAAGIRLSGLPIPDLYAHLERAFGGSWNNSRTGNWRRTYPAARRQVAVDCEALAHGAETVIIPLAAARSRRSKCSGCCGRFNRGRRYFEPKSGEGHEQAWTKTRCAPQADVGIALTTLCWA